MITSVSIDASSDANLASLSSVPAVVSTDTSEPQAGITIPQSLDTSTNIRPILSSIDNGPGPDTTKTVFINGYLDMQMFTNLQEDNMPICHT